MIDHQKEDNEEEDASSNFQFLFLRLVFGSLFVDGGDMSNYRRFLKMSVALGFAVFGNFSFVCVCAPFQIRKSYTASARD